MPKQQPVGRRPMLAKVHIARKEMGLDEESYRAILRRVLSPGLKPELQRESLAGAADAELERVMDEFKRLGWTPKRRATPLSSKPHVRMIYAIWKDMAPLLQSGGTREALRAFVQRQTEVSAPEFLDPAQGTLVIEGLKAWRARLQRGGK